MARRPAIPDRMNVLLVGGGGREHALAWKLKQSPRLARLWTTHPTNPGLAELADPIGFPFSMKESYRLRQFCTHERIALVVVGPEEPLAQGIADELTTDQTLVFGPTSAAAQLEADKAWAKRFMRSALIPTAEARTFTDPNAAMSYVESRDQALVVKASGLAAGKGVFICPTPTHAADAVRRIMLERVFGDAGREVVIEERLDGPELSVFALTDGRDLLVLDACRDHKRLLDNDEGPNTGGMGAYSPTSLLTPTLLAEIQRKILVPAIDSLRREGIEYRGLLYAGLMLTHAGPKVLEFNVRFGDPETQALLPRLKGDLLELLWCAAAGPGALADAGDIEWDSRASCCIVLASPGYPDQPRTGLPIIGVEKASAMPGVLVFHAGTARAGDGNTLVTAGGRVLGVVALGPSLGDARARALDAADTIHFEGRHFRRDIASRE